MFGYYSSNNAVVFETESFEMCHVVIYGETRVECVIRRLEYSMSTREIL